MNLSGRTAIVTGGAVRLGRSMALAMAGQGVNILIHFGKSETESTADEIRERGVQAETISADLSDPEFAARKIFDRCEQAFGAATILVNSAAIFESASLGQTTGEIWDRHHAINLKSPFFLAKKFTEQLPSEKRGHIVNLLDWRATNPAGGRDYLAYTIAKSGLAAMTEALAVELGPRIQVNGIAPGAILPAPDKSREGFENLARQNPLNRVGNPQEIVKTLLYLLRTDFVTGEILHVDGGERLPA